MTDAGRIVELRFSLEGADLERLVLVGSDLEFLCDLPRDRLLTHTEVRVAASVLRRLLADSDRQLLRVWSAIAKGAPVRLTLDAQDLDTNLDRWPEHWVRTAWAGGAGLPLAHHNGFILGVVPKEEAEECDSVEALIAAKDLPMSGQRRTLTLADWLARTSVAIQTNELGLVRISRQAVLTYIANRKGGVHFDPERDLTLPRKKRRHRREIESILLDHGLLRVGHLTGPEFEVVSMVHDLTKAEWVATLIDVSHRVTPDDFNGDPRELKVFTGTKEADGTGWATMTYGDSPQT